MLKVSRKFIFVLLLITLIIELPLYARADMGAKPSITLKVVNAPADYYVGLLGYRGQSEAANSVLYVEKYDEESVDEYLRGFHLDGWMYSLSPVGPSMYPASEEGSYYFFYSIPRPFRVILIAEDGRVYVSEIMDQKEYNSDCTYDVSCGIVTEDLAGKTANRISYIVLCYVLTILIELFMLWVFQYPLYRRNLIRFLVINTITQISLNIYLANAVPGLVYLFFCVLAEILIMLVEGIYFGLSLVNKDGNKKFGKGFLYGITANVVSALAGVVFSSILASVFHVME